MRLCYNARCSAGVAQLVERVIGNDEVHGSDSHHQLQKENRPSRVVFFLELHWKGVGAAIENCPVDSFPRHGERKPEAAPPAGQADRRLREDSHHQLQKENHPSRVVFFLEFKWKGVKGRIRKSPSGAFSRPRGAHARGCAVRRASRPQPTGRLPSPARAQVSPFRDPSTGSG